MCSMYLSIIERSLNKEMNNNYIYLHGGIKMVKSELTIDISGDHTEYDIIIGTYGLLSRMKKKELATEYFNRIKDLIDYDQILEITKEYVVVEGDE